MAHRRYGTDNATIPLDAWQVISVFVPIDTLPSLFYISKTLQTVVVPHLCQDTNFLRLISQRRYAFKFPIENSLYSLFYMAKEYKYVPYPTAQQTELFRFAVDKDHLPLMKLLLLDTNTNPGENDNAIFRTAVVRNKADVVEF
jgi:hypothetical protein